MFRLFKKSGRSKGKKSRKSEKKKDETSTSQEAEVGQERTPESTILNDSESIESYSDDSTSCFDDDPSLLEMERQLQEFSNREGENPALAAMVFHDNMKLVKSANNTPISKSKKLDRLIFGDQQQIKQLDLSGEPLSVSSPKPKKPTRKSKRPKSKSKKTASMTPSDTNTPAAAAAGVPTSSYNDLAELGLASPNTARRTIKELELLFQGEAAKKNADPLSGSFHSLKDLPLNNDLTPTETKSEMKKSNSDVNLESMVARSEKKRAAKKTAPQPAAPSNDDCPKPDDYLRSLLDKMGITAEARSNKEIEDFFYVMEPENFKAYDSEVAKAARTGDLDGLLAHIESGKPILCCNKFQETIIHTICRRGHHNALSYVVNEADATLRIRDEQGRTPLHDAAWTHQPNFDLIEIILQECPDLLLVKDNRGFTPLAYAAKQCWSSWCKFLDDHHELLMPNFLK